MAVSFVNLDVDFTIRNSRDLRNWVGQVVRERNRKVGAITFVFCSDAALVERNIGFLGHQTLTDVITFDYSDERQVAGDVLISVERVAENARRFAGSFEEEMMRVMIHGVLHLLGFLDKLKPDKVLMTETENVCLQTRPLRTQFRLRGIISNAHLENGLANNQTGS